MNDIRTVESFIDAFNTKDIDTIMAFFTEDAIYHNMPAAPVQGLEGIRKLISTFVDPADEINWVILCIAQTGDTVLTERMDSFVVGGRDVNLPVMGAFVMRNGKIAAWRDYFDLATWRKQT